MKINESCLVRRHFLGSMLGGGMVALGATAAPPLAAYVGNLRTKPPPDFIVLDRDQYDLPPGESRIVLYDRIPVLIFRTPLPKGELRLFVATCTHFDCTVSYQAEENRILCACHEGYYDIDGRVTAGPPPAPLREFHSMPWGDRLIIALEAENLAKAAAEEGDPS